jgi:hypothetical protein
MLYGTDLEEGKPWSIVKCAKKRKSKKKGGIILGVPEKRSTGSNAYGEPGAPRLEES